MYHNGIDNIKYICRHIHIYMHIALATVWVKALPMRAPICRSDIVSGCCIRLGSMPCNMSISRTLVRRFLHEIQCPPFWPNILYIHIYNIHIHKYTYISTHTCIHIRVYTYIIYNHTSSYTYMYIHIYDHILWFCEKCLILSCRVPQICVHSELDFSSLAQMQMCICALTPFHSNFFTVTGTMCFAPLLIRAEGDAGASEPSAQQREAKSDAGASELCCFLSSSALDPWAKKGVAPCDHVSFSRHLN